MSVTVMMVLVMPMMVVIMMPMLMLLVMCMSCIMNGVFDLFDDAFIVMSMMLIMVMTMMVVVLLTHFQIPMRSVNEQMCNIEPTLLHK